MPSSGPIGIFDSGIGGLTVASALLKQHPEASLIYFGDTAYLPYGDKSEETIISRVQYILEFLMDSGCNTIITACNSASSVLPKIQTPEHIRLLNVIDPVIDALPDSFEDKTVGVIGTRRTIASGVYQMKLAAKFPLAKSVAMATPLLAPLIEEGFISDEIADEVVEAYLDRMGDLDALILGCTHYPLIQDRIAKYYQNKTLLFSAPEYLVNLLDSNLEKGPQKFYVSDYTDSFEQTADFFFGSEIHLEKAE
jgi:glutamate racemase